MKYFGPGFQSFFRELTSHNDREWFKEHKGTYEKEVKAPFEKLVEGLIEQSREFAPEINIEAKDAIFRIYKDTRFSKDKTPYKDSVSAVISQGGRKDMATPGFYLEIKADQLRVYGGLYNPDKTQVQKVREAMASQPEEFKRLLLDPTFSKLFGTLRGEQHKRIPKEFQEAAAQQPLIANKQFYYYTDLDPKLIISDTLSEKILEAFRAGVPMKEFLAEAVA